MNRNNRNIAKASIAGGGVRLWMAFCCLFITSVVLEALQRSGNSKTVAGGIMEISLFATIALLLYSIQDDWMAEICHINLFHHKNPVRRQHGWRNLEGQISKRSTNTVHWGVSGMLSIVELPRPPNLGEEQNADLPEFYTCV